jgi:hypothetical protein
MKRLMILSLLITGLINTSIGQKNTYGLSIGVAKGFIMKQALDGDASYDLNTGFSIGFHYNRKLTDKLYIETGIDWYNSSVSVTPSFYPNIDMTPKEYDIQLIYIPVFVRVDLSKYFYLNGGLIGDFDITKDNYITNQSGIGAGFGLGTGFSITDKIVIELNPYLNFHGLVLVDKENYPERICDFGVKLNLLIK